MTVAGEVRCWGSNGFNNQATPPNNLGPVAQVGVGKFSQLCIAGGWRVGCAAGGTNPENRIDSQQDLFTQLAVADFHNCAVTVAGEVHCWGSDSSGRASPPNELGPDGALGAVAQVGVGDVSQLCVDGGGSRCTAGGVVRMISAIAAE